MFSSATAAEKLGQPVPESNLAVELNSALPPAIIPDRFKYFENALNPRSIRDKKDEKRSGYQ
jgi:hypothetical protein